jgi:hypothetical protein
LEPARMLRKTAIKNYDSTTPKRVAANGEQKILLQSIKRYFFLLIQIILNIVLDGRIFLRRLVGQTWGMACRLAVAIINIDLAIFAQC